MPFSEAFSSAIKQPSDDIMLLAVFLLEFSLKICTSPWRTETAIYYTIALIYAAERSG